MALQLYQKEDFNTNIGTWFEGNKFPLELGQIWQVKAIYADGEELSRIRDTMPSVPCGSVSQREMAWYGEMARCITAAMYFQAKNLMPAGQED